MSFTCEHESNRARQSVNPSTPLRTSTIAVAKITPSEDLTKCAFTTKGGYISDGD